MPHDYLAPLLEKNDTKIILLILDGLGGTGMPPDGKTALETAHTPNLDRMAEEGCLGQTIPVRHGITAGSGPAHLALFGYDPLEYVVGRGVLSASGINVQVNPGDIAARGNLCSLDDQGRVTDRRAGRISHQKAAPIIKQLNEVQIPDVKVEVHHVKEYRFVVIMRGEDLSPALNDTDPQETGVQPLPLRPGVPGKRNELPDCLTSGLKKLTRPWLINRGPTALSCGVLKLILVSPPMKRRTS